MCLSGFPLPWHESHQAVSSQQCAVPLREAQGDNRPGDCFPLGLSQPPYSLAAEQAGQLTQVPSLFSWQSKLEGRRRGGGKGDGLFFFFFFQVPLPGNQCFYWEVPLMTPSVADDRSQKGPGPHQSFLSGFILSSPSTSPQNPNFYRWSPEN